MKNKGFTLVEIMIVVAIIALLAAIAIPNLLRQRITANESAAQATLRTISTAFETYAAANNGQYPTDVATQLIGVTPPYLNENYFTKCVAATPCSGYVYAVSGTLATTGYTVTARPVSCTTSGTKSYQVTTGSVLSTDVACTAAVASE
ncbi:MAG: prepilin-type N-terminal cleavage/methylation domain-containing protein [Candidatus Omnitrophota bacterium]